MRFLIVSDLHANIDALNIVLADATGEYDSIVCCGDLVGYNPNPSDIVDWTRTHCATVIRGNHDKVIAGIDDLEWFNPVAQISARWTMNQLSPDQMQYLRELPMGPLDLEYFHVFHGAPFDEDEYILSLDTARISFEYLQHPVSFFGHSHIQGGFFDRHRHIGVLPKVPADQHELVIELEADTIYMINPGAVGQPRDGDPRAAYALYDTDRKLVILRRVAYPIEETNQKIKNAGLPDFLGLRLFHGQ